MRIWSQQLHRCDSGDCGGMIGRRRSRGCATRTGVIVRFGRLGVKQDSCVSSSRRRPCACPESVIAFDFDSCSARDSDGDDGVRVIGRSVTIRAAVAGGRW